MVTLQEREAARQQSQQLARAAAEKQEAAQRAAAARERLQTGRSVLVQDADEDMKVAMRTGLLHM